MADDPNNPSGALPGDPRYGLSKEELTEYYKTKSPSWICKGYFKTEGGLELREAGMEGHQAHLQGTQDQIRFTGPLLKADSKTPRGAMAMIGTVWLTMAQGRTLMSMTRLWTIPIASRMPSTAATAAPAHDAVAGGSAAASASAPCAQRIAQRTGA
mgnify:CR=1 FL=1